MLCLLADRDLTPSGVPVTFFGARATMPAGPAALALRTGAALIPTTLWYSGDAVNGALGGADRAAPDPAHRRRDDDPGAGRRLRRRRSPRIPPTGTCCSGSGSDDLDARPSAARREPAAGTSDPARRRGCSRIRPVRIGLACPYTWDVPGGVQVHVRDLAETPDPAGPRGLGHHAGRRRGPPAALRRLGRQGDVGALQRLGRPASCSGRCRPRGCGAGCATATSTSSTPTSRPRRASACWPAWRRPDRSSRRTTPATRARGS